MVPSIEADTVLVLDYTGLRTEAAIDELDLESAGLVVRYLLEPPYPHELTGADYAAQLVKRHGPFGSEVTAVLAYCMAAPIAQELIAIVSAEADHDIPLVLFDAEVVTRDAVQAQYLLAGRKLGELLSLPSEASIPGGRIEESALRDSPAEVLELMHRGLVELGAEAARRAGSDQAEARADASAVADFYLDWLAHLVAGHNSSGTAWRGTVFHVVSRDHPLQQRWPGSDNGHTSRLPVSRDDLLRHPDARSVVLSVLEKGA